MELDIEVVLASERYIISLWRNILIVHWSQQATADGVRDVAAQWAVLAGRHKRFSYLCLIAGGAGLPDGEARDALRDLHDQHAAGTVCIAVALLGNHFWSSAQKGMITGIRQKATQKRPSELRMEASTAELRDWFVTTHSERSGVALTGEEFDALVEATLYQVHKLEAR